MVGAHLVYGIRKCQVPDNSIKKEPQRIKFLGGYLVAVVPKILPHIVLYNHQ